MLTDASATDDGVLVRRVKGSADNLTRWCPELREAWSWLLARRARSWTRTSDPLINSQGYDVAGSTVSGDFIYTFRPVSPRSNAGCGLGFTHILRACYDRVERRFERRLHA